MLACCSQVVPAQDPHSDYKFGPQLGRGEFGVIYLVTSKSGDKYACKVLSKFKPRFSLSAVYDEVKALQQVSGHPNIISLHQVTSQTALFRHIDVQDCHQHRQ